MKKINLLAMTAIVSGTMFMACGNNPQNDSKEAADSINEAKVEQTQSEPENTATTGTAVSEEDAKFAVAAADGGMMEVELGKLAQTKAVGQQVKDFGAMMVDDHVKANEALMALAQKKNITLPAVIGKDNQQIIDDMAKKTGKDFDKAYVKAMVKDHKKDIELFEDALNKVQDVDIKQFITATLPTLKKHMGHIETLDKNSK